eukprot:Gb_02433 [translate_table: standard]
MEASKTTIHIIINKKVLIKTIS